MILKSCNFLQSDQMNIKLVNNVYIYILIVVMYDNPWYQTRFNFLKSIMSIGFKGLGSHVVWGGVVYPKP